MRLPPISTRRHRRSHTTQVRRSRVRRQGANSRADRFDRSTSFSLAHPPLPVTSGCARMPTDWAIGVTQRSSTNGTASAKEATSRTRPHFHATGGCGDSRSTGLASRRAIGVSTAGGPRPFRRHPVIDMAPRPVGAATRRNLDRVTRDRSGAAGLIATPMRSAISSTGTGTYRTTWQSARSTR